ARVVYAVRRAYTGRVGRRSFFFSSRRRHTRFKCDWSSDVCSSDLDVEVGKLLPRPIGVFAVPAERRADFNDVVDMARQGQALGYEVHTAERDGQLLLSFDRSLDLYIKDAAERRQFPSARWAVRADSAKLVPILSQLSENLGLRIASPRIFRGARDADRWISAL